MDQWHANFKPNFLPRSGESSFNFLFNYNIEPFPGMDPARQAEMMTAGAVQHHGQHHHHHHMVGVGVGECDVVGSGGDPKKKRLTSEQLESLEKSFQEEIKLDPDRKMKLSRDLGLQPRQVAVWFQNRRARWKAKQLERLYHSLKLDFESVSREKHNLQDEVIKLRAMLMDQATRSHNLNTNKQVSIGCTEISAGDETVESTSVPGLGTPHQTAGVSPEHSMAECHYLFGATPEGVDDYNCTVASPPPPPYWPPLPSSYPC